MAEINSINIHCIAVIVLLLIYVSLLIIEHKWPLRQATRPLIPRLVVNFSFSILVYATASLLIAPIAKLTIAFTGKQGFGLLFLLPENKILVFVLGFLLMDLTFYYWHRLNHEWQLLWRFHNVHHVDPDLDVTTAMRFHCVEIAYSTVFRFFQLALFGINPMTFFCYEFIFQTNTFIHHSNLKLPIGFERIMNVIFVTPRMHGIHHSNYLDETNRNYGVVFSFWDRLHRTLKLNIPQQSIGIGVPGYQQNSDNTLLNLLCMPIKKQRAYWLLNNKKYYKRTKDKMFNKFNHLSE